MQFQSDQSVIDLNINGHHFTVHPDSSLAERVSLLAGEADFRADFAHRSDCSDYSAVADFLCYVVDTIVGDGTVDEVFCGDEPDVFDLCDIISYICDEFSNYRRRRLKRLEDAAGGDCS